MTFPGVMEMNHIKFEDDKENDAWSSVLFMLTYNCGDTLGKYLAGKLKKFSKLICIGVYMFRWVNIFIYFYIAVGGDNPPWV